MTFETKPVPHSCIRCGTDKVQRLSHLWYIDWRGLPASAGLWICKNAFKCRTRQQESRPARMKSVKPQPKPSRGSI